MPDEASIPPAKPPAFKRGLLSINFKFTFVMGLLLVGLLVLVALVANDQIGGDLTREVAERGNTVARNVAVKAFEPLLQGDDITLAQLLKDSVEAAPAQGAAAEGLPAQIMADLRRALAPPVQARKSEGIARIVLIKQAPAEGADGQAGPGASTYYDSGDVKAQSSLALPQSRLLPDSQDPFPSFEENGQSYFDIAQPIADGGKTAGTLHLYLRRAVIGDAVRVATTSLAAVMLVSLLTGLLLLLLLTRFLLAPVRLLMKGVNAVAAGDFGVQLTLKRRDELGELVTAYNGMAKNLKEKEAIQEALAKYTSKDLVNQMLGDKAKLDLGGKRVHATILFSVVRGMHALSQTLPAEEYVALVNEYLEVETDVIMHNGGSIDKFIGDEVMALWGLSGGDPADMAYQAVKAAVELQEAIGQLNKMRIGQGDQPFLVSIGVNNGEVVSGNMGSSVKMDYTVLGGNVNLAARLGLVAAQGGQTIVSHSVYSLVAERFQIDKLAPMQLKGIKEPVPLYWPRKALR